MYDLLIIIGALIVACILSRLMIPYILLISFRKRLFDEPDVRKVHRSFVPRLGGVAFSPIIIFTICFFTPLYLLWKNRTLNNFILQEGIEHLFMVAGLILLYIIGIADDLIGVRYRNKFLFQSLSAVMLPLSGLYINNFYGLLGIHEINPIVGIFLTVLLVVFIVNATNLVDGIDGLASGLSMVAFAVFGCLFLWRQMWLYALSAFVCIGVLIPFFYYNVFGGKRHVKKIFMGDAGSLTLGYLQSFFIIKYCMLVDSVTSDYISSPILVSFGVLLVPCLDAVRVALRRIRNKKNPFLPDKTHIHHKFLDMGFSPRMAMITILFMSLCFFLFNILAIRYLNSTLVFVMDVLIWTVLNVWFDYCIFKRMKF